MKHINFRSVTITLISIFGIVSLALSYDALYLVASKHGHTGWRAYAWPTLIDFPLVVLTVAMLYAQIMRIGSWTVTGLLSLVLAYTGATIYLNYLESDDSIEGIFVRIAAPVGIFVCTEVLRHLAKFEVEKDRKIKSLTEIEEILQKSQDALSQLSQDIENKQSEMELLTNEVSRLQITSSILSGTRKGENLKALLSYLSDNPQASYKEAGEELGVTYQTVSRYVTELEENELLLKNGSGWEVV